MKTDIRIAVRAIVLGTVIAMAITACNRSGTPVAPSQFLRIDTVTPAVPPLSPTPQALSLTGIGFDQGLLMTTSAPDGTVTTSPVTISSATQATTTATFAAAGTYTLALQNTAGAVSPQFIIVEPGSAGSLPVVLSVSPAATAKGSQSQALRLTGAGFISAQSVQVIGPDGQVSILTLGQFTIEDDSHISFNVVLNKTGSYLISVANAIGSSTVVAVSVG